jgi:hypothetical protein
MICIGSISNRRARHHGNSPRCRLYTAGTLTIYGKGATGAIGSTVMTGAAVGAAGSGDSGSADGVGLAWVTSASVGEGEVAGADGAAVVAICFVASGFSSVICATVKVAMI